MAQPMKKRFTPEVSFNLDSKENFADLFASLEESSVQEGKVTQGTVVAIDSDAVTIDVGVKNEGRIPLSEFSLNNEHKNIEIGDKFDVYVEKIENMRGQTVLSREKAIREEVWVDLEQAHDKKENVDGVIFGRVKGGFTVDLSGVVAFLPGSQVDVRPIKDVTPLMNIVQPFQILKMDKKLGNIVVSRRAILEESRSEARDKMLSNISEGQTMEGIVKNITDYGAFIDLGSIDGLLHVTDISWSRINHPSEVLSIGQKIEVMIIKYNEDTKRISLGMKQLEDNPWKGIEEKYPLHKRMRGKVTNITDYGAFIELEPGIEGLVHVSEISWTKSNQHPRKLINIGQEVDFEILEVDSSKQRISLGMKQCQENPWEKFAEKHEIGSTITAPVRNVVDFGVFVALDDDIDGLVHVSDIDWDEEAAISRLKDFKKNEEVTCKILGVELDKERISLGIKQLTPDPFENDANSFNKGDIVTCQVSAVKDDGIEVTFGENVTSFIKKSDLSTEKVEQRTDRFSEGDRIDAKVTSFDKNTRKISLSIKALEIAEQKKAIKEYGSIDSGASLGDILGEALNQTDKDK